MARKASIWVTEKYTSSSGKVSHRYKLDADGNKILKDLAIAAKKDEKKVFKPKKPPKEADKEKAEAMSKPKAREEARIIGFVIPDLTAQQAENETFLSAMPVFSTEKGVYKKNLIHPNIEAAKAAIKARYSRDQ